MQNTQRNQKILEREHRICHNGREREVVKREDDERVGEVVDAREFGWDNWDYLGLGRRRAMLRRGRGRGSSSSRSSRSSSSSISSMRRRRSWRRSWRRRQGRAAAHHRFFIFIFAWLAINTFLEVREGKGRARKELIQRMIQ